MKKVVNKEKLDLYRSMLPYGSQIKIAEKTGISQVSISNFLRGRNKSSIVEQAILEELAEIRKERQKLYKKAGIKL